MTSEGGMDQWMMASRAMTDKVNAQAKTDFSVSGSEGFSG